VVRGGEIPFEVAQSSPPILHLVLLVTTLAGLAAMCRLVVDFMAPNAECQNHTSPYVMRPDGCVFTLTYPHNVEDASYRTREPFGMHYLWSILYSTRLDISLTV
jgi:hypothetical protein